MTSSPAKPTRAERRPQLEQLRPLLAGNVNGPAKPGCGLGLNQTKGDLYTSASVREYSSVRHAHETERVGQTCAQRTLRRVCQYRGFRLRCWVSATPDSVPRTPDFCSVSSPLRC